MNMLNKQRGYTLSEIITLLVAVILIIGWFANIYWVATTFITAETLADITPFVILRIIGIFVAPMGGVLGYFPN